MSLMSIAVNRLQQYYLIRDGPATVSRNTGPLEDFGHPAPQAPPGGGEPAVGPRKRAINIPRPFAHDSR